MNLRDLLLNPSDLLALEPQELAWPLLTHLKSQGQQFILRANLTSGLLYQSPECDRQPMAKAIMEAWQFLDVNGLIAAEPGSQYPSYFITRTGQQIQTDEQFSDYRNSRLFPRESLHPLIAEKAFASYLRGEYETAIFQALKTVEVEVRGAAQLDLKSYGTDLMRKAFNPQTGPLTDYSEPEAEREALMFLFSGAIGRFKNPASHRHMGISDPLETAEVLHIASHLLRVVNDRRK